MGHPGESGRFATLAICSTIVLLGLSAAPAQASTASAGPSIKLTPAVGPPTSPVKVHGSGFARRETVSVWFGAKEVGTATTDARGRFDLTFDVPKGAHPGDRTVKAKGSAHESAKATFLVRTDWSQFRFDPTHSGTNPYENVLSPKTVGGLQERWAFQMADASESSTVVVDGVVYGGTNGSDVYALDAATGQQLWHYISTGTGERGVAVADGIVYAPCSVGVDALDASDGHRLWHFSAFEPRPVAIAGGVVYFGSYEGGIYAVDARTGQQDWYHPTGAVASSPAVADGMVYVGTEDDTVYAVDAATGAERWTFTTGGEVHSSPAVAGGIVYLGSDDGTIYALDGATGAKVWSFFSPDGEVDSSPAVSGGVVYTGAYKHIYALDAATGALIWDDPEPINIIPGPAVANGVVYTEGVLDHQSVIEALDGATGDMLWYDVPGSLVSSSPTVSDGVLYFTSDDHHLYAFGL